MDASLHLRDLTRLYGKVRALDGLTLDIPQGSFVTLLGPSGCGKSTTLSILAGLDRPDSGTVHMGEADITTTPPNERRMAMVFQNYALYPHMDAYDNIGFSLRLARRPRAEIDTRVRAVAEMLDIGHLLRRKPGQLSGGQQQRVALGRALVKQPLVFLLDEPFSNLDAALRARMRTEVKHLHLRLGTTSVFVTHDQEEALSLSDHIAVMREGHLVQFGTQSEIYRHPKDTYVATFVGKPRMSLAEGRLELSAEDAWFVAEGLSVGLGGTPGLRLAGPPPERVTLGVRAEDLLVAAGRSDVRGSFPATVQLTEPVGSDTFLELGAGEATFVARVPPDLDIAIGDTVTVRVAAGRAHLFDTATGLRLAQASDA
jgi:ABC-type sugar transport system ATPase subunit